MGLNYTRRLMKGCCTNVKLGPFNWLFKGKELWEKSLTITCVYFFLVSFNLYVFNLLGLYKYVYIVGTML